MKYLVAVDIQQAFVKTPEAVNIYHRCIDYVLNHRDEYDKVIAVLYEDDGSNPNMDRLLAYNECKTEQKAPFNADEIVKHAGYFNCKLLKFNPEDEVHILGFDTDACVLATAFNVFDMGCDFKVFTDLCWSSGGKIMHLTGLEVMKRNFGKAVTTSRNEGSDYEA